MRQAFSGPTSIKHWSIRSSSSKTSQRSRPSAIPQARPLNPANMRRTLTNLAAVKPSRYLEAGAPTGLTGLYTHPTPRKALLYLYNSTLEKLQQIPESSLYRQSTEALTRHRLNIVKGVEPEGYKEWKVKADAIIAEHPEVFNTPAGESAYKGGKYLKEVKNGEVFVTIKGEGYRDDLTEEWDGVEDTSAELEGIRTEAERRNQINITKPMPNDFAKDVKYEAEPPLTVQQ